MKGGYPKRVGQLECQFSSGGIVHLPKFEMTMVKTEANQKPVLAAEDVHIVTIDVMEYPSQDSLVSAFNSIFKCENKQFHGSREIYLQPFAKTIIIFRREVAARFPFCARKKLSSFVSKPVSKVQNFSKHGGYFSKHCMKPGAQCKQNRTASAIFYMTPLRNSIVCKNSIIG